MRNSVLNMDDCAGNAHLARRAYWL